MIDVEFFLHRVRIGLLELHSFCVDQLDHAILERRATDFLLRRKAMVYKKHTGFT